MKNVAQTLLFCLPLILGLNHAVAQECKEKVDPFTNEKLVEYDFMKGTVVYEQKDGLTLLKVKLNLDGEVNMAFEEGTPFLLKTEKDKIIKLSTSEKCMPVSQVSGSRVISSVVFVCKVNAEQLQDLAESKVVLIRHADGKGGQYDLPINKKVGNGFLEGASCMLKSS